MSTFYIIFLASLTALFFLSFFAIRVLNEALKLNPKVKTLDELLSQITTAQATLTELEEKIEEIKCERDKAERLIEEAKIAQDFLNTHETEVKNKQSIIDELNTTIRNYNDMIAKKENELQDLNEKYAECLEEIDDKVKEKNKLEIEEESISKRIEEKTAKNKEILSEIKQNQEKQASLEELLNDLRKEKEQLEREILKLKDEMKSYDDKKKSVDELSSKITSMKKEVGELQGKADTLSELVSQRQSIINTLDEDKSKKELSMWKDLDQKPSFSLIIDQKNAKAGIDERAFLDEFKDQLRSNSIIFNDRTINAFHTGLKAEEISPILVLSGISGTGKSLLPKLYAQAIGMNFLTVPVQPRWDSPQDMLGFFNYMQDKYKATELSRLLWYTDRFNNKNCIYENDRSLPMNLILLDEMNLARVEYYFSDLLSKLEFRRMISNPENEKERNAAELEVECGVVGKEKVTRRLYINGNTLFVGTMNEDETTQILSDKVVDRSNMIRFGKPEELQSKPSIENFGKHYETNSCYISYGTWSSFKNERKIFDEKKLKDTVNELLKCMDSIGRPFAYRVWQSIETYVSLYPNSDKKEAFYNAISDQIEMKVLPKLNGIELGSSIKVDSALSGISNVIKGLEDEKLNEAFDKCRNPEYGSFFQWKGVVR